MQRMEKAMGNNQYPGDMFDFEVETRVQCQECGGVKYTPTKTQQLVIQPPVKTMVEKGTPITFESCLEKYFGDEMVPDFFCGTCNKKTVCVKRNRINTFPKVLVINLFRFIFDNWVPKKLEIELQVPQD